MIIDDVNESSRKIEELIKMLEKDMDSEDGEISEDKMPDKVKPEEGQNISNKKFSNEKADLYLIKEELGHAITQYKETLKKYEEKGGKTNTEILQEAEEVLNTTLKNPENIEYTKDYIEKLKNILLDEEKALRSDPQKEFRPAEQ